MKRFRTFAAGVALPLAAFGFSPLVADAGPSATAASIQNKIQKVQGSIADKKGTERVLTSDIAQWSNKISRLQSKIGALQTQEQRVQADLDLKRAQLARTQAQLRYQRARLVRLRARLAVARKALATRLVELYEADRPDLVTVVLSSKGFADLIERGDFLKRISQQDRAIVTLVRSAKADSISTAKRLDVLEQRQQTIAGK